MNKKKASNLLWKYILSLKEKKDTNNQFKFLYLTVPNVKALIARWIIFFYAIVAGLAVSLLTYTTKLAHDFFDVMRSKETILGDAFIFVWMPTITLITIWLVRTYAPGTIGSGIPQVIAAGHKSMEKRNYQRLVSLKISILKILFTSLSALSGLSVGRQGPSVQIAAGIILESKRWFKKISTKKWFQKKEIDISHDSLLVAGGASGIAAAFNTPLAGIIFAVEEMSQRLGEKNSPMVIISIVLAGLAAIIIHDDKSYLDMASRKTLALETNFIYGVLLLAIIGGIFGGLLSIILISRFHGWGNLFMRWFKKHPYLAGLFCSLSVALLGYISDGRTLIDDYTYTQKIVDGSEKVETSYLIFKYFAIWLSNISGIPGGIFSPSITLGAGIGSNLADLIGVTDAKSLMAIGMVTFLAAVTQAPITSFFIVMELINGYELILGLMASAVLANFIARIFAPPFYSSLANYYINRFKGDNGNTQ